MGLKMEDITPRYIAMEDITDVDYDICDTQEEIFKYVAEMSFDEEDFVEKYMKSRFCNMEMDSLYSCMQTADAEDCMECLLEEILMKENKDDLYYPEDMMGWIGWIYRYLSIRYGIASRHIYERLPFRDMVVIYEGMHTQDEEYVVDVLKEHFPERRV